MWHESYVPHPCCSLGDQLAISKGRIEGGAPRAWANALHASSASEESPARFRPAPQRRHTQEPSALRSSSCFHSVHGTILN